jgi:hypothetical protein
LVRQAKRALARPHLKSTAKLRHDLREGKLCRQLPKHRVESLEVAGAGERFDPGHGRLMKEWLAFQATSGENWFSLAREAMRLVGQNQA